MITFVYAENTTLPFSTIKSDEFQRHHLHLGEFLRFYQNFAVVLDSLKFMSSRDLAEPSSGYTSDYTLLCLMRA